MESRAPGSRNWRLPAALVAVLLAGWAGIFWLAGRGSAGLPSSSRPRLHPSDKHFVTPQQLVASGALSEQSLGSMTVVGHDGKRREWKDLAPGRPLVVVFIKRGCPCSVEFEPFFHRLAGAWQESVRLIDVIDGDVETARRYAEVNRVPYLVLADPQRQVISRFGAKNGAYVALVRPDGILDTLWPGCSSEMMLELNRRIASFAGKEEKRLDTSGLPTALTTGCPFEDGPGRGSTPHPQLLSPATGERGARQGPRERKEQP
jgi:peroxiredoxin